MRITAQVLEYGMKILPGANVAVVDASGNVIGQTAMTDSNGQFVLEVPSADSLVRISYVGFDYDTFRAGDLDGNYVELYPSATELGEVVITNTAKSGSNTLLYVLLAIAGTFGATQLIKRSQNRPKTVKP